LARKLHSRLANREVELKRRLVFLVACSWGMPSAVSAQSAPQLPKIGIASWYGTSFQGRRSASGEIYDQEKLTAAHRTLPFGTRVRVRRLDTGGTVVVRINDRGPFAQSRIIDLSRAAADRLGMTKGGVARITLEVMKASETWMHPKSLPLGRSTEVRRVEENPSMSLVKNQ
jgi:rare lipoprotein A